MEAIPSILPSSFLLSGYQRPEIIALISRILSSAHSSFLSFTLLAQSLDLMVEEWLVYILALRRTWVAVLCIDVNRISREARRGTAADSVRPHSPPG